MLKMATQNGSSEGHKANTHITLQAARAPQPRGFGGLPSSDTIRAPRRDDTAQRRHRTEVVAYP